MPVLYIILFALAYLPLSEILPGHPEYTVPCALAAISGATWMLLVEHVIVHWLDLETMCFKPSADRKKRNDQKHSNGHSGDSPTLPGLGKDDQADAGNDQAGHADP